MRSSTARIVMPALADPKPIPLSAYQTVTAAGTVLAPWLVQRRLARHKESLDRIAERRGEPSAPRPPGPLVWMHGASVGEFVAVLPLLERIRVRGFTVLMTTGTVTSAELAEKRLPSGALHQFLPLDMPSFVTRFLDSSHPDLPLFVESDPAPNPNLSPPSLHIPILLT